MKQYSTTQLSEGYNLQRERTRMQGATLVAGGAGFLGSAILRELAASGSTAVCLDNYHRGSITNVAELREQVEIVNHCALDLEGMIAIFRDHHVSSVITCIGDTFVPAAYELPERFFEINVMANLNVLKASLAAGVQSVLYVSSTEVYGNADAHKISEDSPLAPLNTYAVSKLAADRLCFTFALEHGLNVRIARIFNCYGPRETHPYLIPEMISQLYHAGELTLGNLRATRDFTFVHDTAWALIELLRADIGSGCVVNVGSDCEYSIEEIGQSLCDLMGLPAPKVRVDPRRLRRCDIDRFRCDNSKLMSLTGWKPTVSLSEGLRLTLNWFQENGYRWPYQLRYDSLQSYPADTAVPCAP